MKPTVSGWERKMFKKNKVWVATDAQGNLLIHKNRALIKYQLDQAYEYWVNPDKLREISGTASDKKRTVKTPREKRGFIGNENLETKQIDINNKAVIIYTDGASSGNPGPAGIGVVMQYGGHEKEISKFIGTTTNNIAELTAVHAALKNLKRKDLPVRIYTDSSYVYNLLMSGWKANKNRNLVNSIKKLISRFEDLQVIKIKGHEGLPGNERADRLATSAIRSSGKPD